MIFETYSCDYFVKTMNCCANSNSINYAHIDCGTLQLLQPANYNDINNDWWKNIWYFHFKSFYLINLPYWNKYDQRFLRRRLKSKSTELAVNNYVNTFNTKAPVSFIQQMISSSLGITKQTESVSYCDSNKTLRF